MTNPRQGLTLVEVLVVLALLSGAGAAAWRWAEVPYAFARSAAASLISARARAVATGQPVAVGPVACTGFADRTPLAVGSASIVRFPVRGLVFLPNGMPRTCDGGGVGNATIVLALRGRQAAVIVSSLGRVRWEPR